MPRPKLTVHRQEHPFEWLAEPLADEPTLVLKSWFGGKSIMTHGMHRLFLTAQGEPWQGVLVCTSHEHQETLLKDVPTLAKHPVLGKWLYLSESTDGFERDAKKLVRMIKAGDVRIGVAPTPRKKKVKKGIKFGGKL